MTIKRPSALGALVVVICLSSAPAAARPRGQPTPTVRVQIIPRWSGVRVVYRDRTYVTDTTGGALVPGTSVILPFVEVPPQMIAPGVRVDGGRWFGENRFGMNVYGLVRFEFTDRNGAALDADRLSSMVIKSTVGEELTFGKADLKRDHWLFSRRTVTSQDRVASRSIEYSVQEVVVRGSNVVNRAQQRFTPSETGVFKIALLFYPADFAVRDALFGFPIGSTLELTYPDGSTERLALDDRGRAVAPALPRGEYLVSVDGPGLALSAPVALTRPQKADIIFLSFIDIGAAIIGGLAYFAGLPLVGAYVRRRRLPSHLMGTDEPVPPRAANGQFTSASASFYGRRGAAERERRLLEQFASPEIRRGEERERGSQRGSNGHHG